MLTLSFARLSACSDVLKDVTLRYAGAVSATDVGAAAACAASARAKTKPVPMRLFMGLLLLSERWRSGLTRR